MERLNEHVLGMIFEYLRLYELASLLQTSKNLNSICRSDFLWRNICNILFPSVTSDFYRNFVAEIPKFLKISNALYNILEIASKTEQKLLYRSLLSTSNPLLASFLPKYHSKPKGSNPFKSFSDFSDFSASVGISVGTPPIEYYWLYLLYNGQFNNNSGLFGSYEFYDTSVNLNFQHLSKANSILMIAKSGENDVVLFADVNNKIGKGHWALFTNSRVGNTILYLAPDIGTYIHEYSQKLLNKQLNFMNEQISLYENNHYSSVNSENGIKIHASALYIPHLSRQEKFMWSYQITISADNPIKKWKLTTRTWKIVDANGKQQTVDRQPGVIGLYPLVYQNCEPTVYRSCCYLETISGEMSGYFTFKNTQDHSEAIDVTIRPFRLELPLGSELIDISHLI